MAVEAFDATQSILQTKVVVPPSRTHVVLRPHLLHRLNAGLDTGLTLLSAPAGFGKTTLVLDWLAQLHTHSACWLTLDAADNDPVRFFAYFSAALRSAGADAGATAVAALQAPNPPPLMHLCTLLLNDLTGLDRPLVLILDDYHVIEQPAIHALLLFCLDNWPTNCHLAITSRVDPPFALARRRAQGQLTEIREEDLRLTAQETAVFLNDLLALNLSDRALSLLQQRTEGWAASLQLAALALQGQPDAQKAAIIDAFGGSHMFVMDYFLEEVWTQVDAALQAFLTRTAVLDDLCGPLCDAVTGQSGSQALLERLYHRNLFVSALDHQRRWYRTHHLFRDLLQNQLKRSATPDAIAALHARAGAWYAAHGRPEDAIRHLLHGRDYERAAACILDNARATQKAGRLNTLLGWIDALPKAVRARYPRLLVFQGQALYLSGQLEAADKTLRSAQAVVARLPDSAETRMLRGELATQLAIIASLSDDSTAIIAYAEEALALLPADDLANRARAISMLGVAYGYAGDTARLEAACQQAAQLAAAAGHPFLQAHALQLRASTQVHLGQLHAAARTYRQILAMAADRPERRPPYIGLGLIGLADVQLEWHALADAARNLADGMMLCRQGGIGYMLLNATCTSLRLHQAQGDEAGARAMLAEMTAYLAQNRTLPLALVQWAVYAARFWLWCGDVTTAVDTISRPYPNGAPVDATRLPVVVREVYHVTEAQIALAQGQWQRVSALHDVVLATAEPAGRHGRVVELALLQALAHARTGDGAAALTSLGTALAVAAPQGHVQIFLEHGPPMATLLTRFAAAAGQPADLQQAARALAARFEPQGAAHDTLVEPLSGRELEVLRLLCLGYSNQQIAAELTVSVNTVKKHAGNIYGKLGVHGRTQAIALAHERRLI